MPEFNPPNPYGSYFNFNSAYNGVDPTPSLWRSPSYPTMNPMSSGVYAAMGTPGEGFNPSSREFMQTRQRDIAFQQFIDRALKDDPRTKTVGNAIMQGVYGNDVQGKMMAMSRIGGADAYAGLIGTVMNLPGLSGYFGGSSRSLAVGSLAAATSGLTMNGYGVYGDKSVGLQFANSLMQNVTSKFYGSSGSPILSMTNGLNRDQLGGVMVSAASQGAFNGLNMGSLKNLDASGRSMKFLSDDSTINKITDFLKTTTKALGSLIDVYGNLSSGELLRKAQQITGLDLSRMGNASLIGERLNRLRDTARVTGIDTASMFDLSARAGSYLSSIGISDSTVAGTFGTLAANVGQRNYRGRMQNTSTFYAPSISPMEAVQAAGRDMVGMLSDPMGARMAALELAMGNAGLSSSAAAALRTKAGSFSATVGGIGAIDQLAQSQLGQSLPALVHAMGGPMGLAAALDPSQQEAVGNSLINNFRRTRQLPLIRTLLGRGGILKGNSADMNAMSNLVSNFSNGTIDQLLSGNGGGNGYDMAGLIRQGGFSAAETTGLMADVNRVRGMGGRGMLGYHNLRDVMQQNEFLKTFQPEELRRRNNYMDIPGMPDDFRGGMLGGGFVAGMLDKFTGNDIVSQLQWLNAVSPNRIAGIKSPINMNAASFLDGSGTLDVAAWRKNVVNLRTGLAGTPEGQAMIRKYNLNAVGTGSPLESSVLMNMHSAMSSPDWQSEMSWATMATTNGGKSVIFGAKSDLDRKLKYGDIGKAYLDMARDVRGNSPSEASLLEQSANALLQGTWFKVDPKTGRLLKNDARSVSQSDIEKFADPSFLSKHILHQMSIDGGNFSDKTLSEIQALQGSSLAIRNIQDQEDRLKGTIGPERKRNQPTIDRLEAILAKLKAAGVTDTKMNTTSTMNLTGSLTVEPGANGALALKLNDVLATMMNKGT